MTTTKNTVRRAAAAMLVAIGAVVATGLGAAPQAAAAVDTFVAISYSLDTGEWSWGNNVANLDQAKARSMGECLNHHTNHCVTVSWAQNGCAALAVNGTTYFGGYGATAADAEKMALEKTRGGQAVSKCST
jgi:hypothetical protein